MFKLISETVSICLQGTVFQRRPKRPIGCIGEQQLWSYSTKSQSVGPPYVLTQEDFKIKNDLITKLHSTENRLQEARQMNRRGRAKWLPDFYEQMYIPPNRIESRPQVELYFKSLGLHIAHEARTTWTSLPRV